MSLTYEEKLEKFLAPVNQYAANVRVLLRTGMPTIPPLSDPRHAALLTDHDNDRRFCTWRQK